MIVVGLAGYARAGKDTAGAYLVEHYGFQRVSFADPLRAVLLATDPLVPVRGPGPHARCAGPTKTVRLSKLVAEKGWEGAKTEWPEHPASVRQLLQRLGTEGGRNVIDQDVWVNAALRKLKPAGAYVFTDVRFPNEADAIARLGKTVRVLRPGTGPVNDHPSERALDGFPFDYQLYATTVPELHAAVAEMVTHYGWERR